MNDFWSFWRIPRGFREDSERIPRGLGENFERHPQKFRKASSKIPKGYLKESWENSWKTPASNRFKIKLTQDGIKRFLKSTRSGFECAESADPIWMPTSCQFFRVGRSGCHLFSTQLCSSLSNFTSISHQIVPIVPISTIVTIR